VSATKIAAWVKNGGTLLLTPATAAWKLDGKEDAVSAALVRQPLSHKHYLLDELGLPLPENGQWASREKGPFTAKPENSRFIPQGRSLTFESPSSTYTFPKDAYPNGETLAKFHAPAKYDGSAAILKFSVGKGQVLLFSQYPKISDSLFYLGILSALSVPRYLSFTKEGAPDWDSFKYLLGYVLKSEDGSWIAMVQHASIKSDPHFTPSAIAEKAPFARRLHLHGLPAGDYEAFDIMDGKKPLGSFSGKELSETGIPLAIGYSELKIIQIQRK
jgi:hypothetical protein